MKILNIFKRKKTYLDNAEVKVQVAENKVTQAFEMFSQAQKAIDESNAELEAAYNEAEKERESLIRKVEGTERLKQKAQDTIEMNKRLSERLSDFLV